MPPPPWTSKQSTILIEKQVLANTNLGQYQTPVQKPHLQCHRWKTVTRNSHLQPHRHHLSSSSRCTLEPLRTPKSFQRVENQFFFFHHASVICSLQGTVALSRRNVRTVKHTRMRASGSLFSHHSSTGSLHPVGPSAPLLQDAHAHTR